MKEPHQGYLRAEPDKLRANVPADLRALPRWLLWRQSMAASANEKPRKIPFYVDGEARSGTLDSPEDHSRLVTFNEALETYERDGKPWMGLGVALGPTPNGDVLSGIDLDACIIEGALTSEAKKILAAMLPGGYAEFSPSATGLKLFGSGHIKQIKRPRLEIYSGKRFFTVTGIKLESSGDQLVSLAGAAALARELLGDGDDGERSQRAGSPVAAVTVHEGGRNNALTQFLGTLRARGFTDAQIKQEAHRFNEQRCSPPMATAEVETVLRSALGWKRRYGMHDTGNAQRLLDWHGPDLHYVPELKTWVVWTGSLWQPDASNLRITALAKDAAVRGFAEVSDLPTPAEQQRLAQHLVSAQNVLRLDAAVSAARSEAGVAIPLNTLDAQRDLVGTLDGGVLNLRTDEFRPARREDYITRSLGAAFHPEADCPRWNAFIASQASTELQSYLQRVVGVTMLGNVHRLLLFLYGPSGTGKTVFIEVIKALLGGYAKTAASDLLMSGGLRAKHGPSEALARLAGARMVAVNETNSRDSFDEATIKDLTGRDSVSARELYKGSFEFRPDFTIWVRGNHKPRFSGDDAAMLERLRLVPFMTVVPPAHRDTRLLDRIIAEELPGVLNWALVGVRAVRDVAVIEMPEEVAEATREYAEEMDTLGSWIRDMCMLGPDLRFAAAEGYHSFRTWCSANGIDPWTSMSFYRKMGDRFRKRRIGDVNHYLGVGLKI